MTWTAQNAQNVFWTPKQQTHPLPYIFFVFFMDANANNPNATPPYAQARPITPAIHHPSTSR